MFQTCFILNLSHLHCCCSVNAGENVFTSVCDDSQQFKTILNHLILCAHSMLGRVPFSESSGSYFSQSLCLNFRVYLFF
jgi:hypothetical protein